MLNFSFFLGLVKWNFISISIFRFLSIRDIEKRIWISFFVFALLVIEKQGGMTGVMRGISLHNHSIFILQ